MVNKDVLISLAEGITVAELDEEAVLLDVNTGQYFGLDETGTRIFELLKETSSLERLRQRLSQEYEVDSAQLVSDLQQFLSVMEQSRLINVEPAPVA